MKTINIFVKMVEVTKILKSGSGDSVPASGMERASVRGGQNTMKLELK
ncbi:hypothetical protein D1AOALGA4SA_4945 [Olavius algarvensis Delta 1 endosymbiont]|nr:hypothetical protein D1AOALGA4SA_4945 [Olavius algarvensis Delta 1 endosymbiont]